MSRLRTLSISAAVACLIAVATPSAIAATEKILFLSNRGPVPNHPVFFFPRAFVMNADGGDPLPIAGVQDFPTLSPDRRKIANSGITVSNADGGDVTVVTGRFATVPQADIAPSWSPDGRRITFQRGQPGAVNQGIYTVGADGTGLRRLTNGNEYPSGDTSPDWSPDGRKIVFSRLGSLWVMNADGSAQTSLGTTGNDPDWSPDGTKIATDKIFDSCTPSTCKADIGVVDADGSGQTRITSDPGLEALRPDWSPDGRRLVFEGQPPGASGPRDIYVVNADGHGLTNLTKNGAENAYPDWGLWEPPARGFTLRVPRRQEIARRRGTLRPERNRLSVFARCRALCSLMISANVTANGRRRILGSDKARTSAGQTGNERRIVFQFDKRELVAIRRAIVRHQRLRAKIKAEARDFLFREPPLVVRRTIRLTR